MQKRKLGKSGIEVNPLGMGCWVFRREFFSRWYAGWVWESERMKNR